MASQASRTQKLVYKLREQAVELATLSWCNMYEALTRFMLFPRVVTTAEGMHWQAVPGLQHLPHQALGDTEQPDRKVCATVHLCEAPGAFIAAINHYKHHFAKFLDWDWRALTLSPYFAGNDTAEMLKDDALIVQTSLNWHFGQDESGECPVSCSLWHVLRSPAQPGCPGGAEVLLTQPPLHAWESTARAANTN